MESIVSAAQWVLGKALAPFTANLLEDWAASKDLSTNADNLKDELLLVQIMLNSTRGKEIKDSKLEELLQKLRDLAYDADEVLDELEYFRIQDELDETSETADQHSKGWAHDLVRNAFHTAKACSQQVGLPVWFSAAAVRGGKRKAEETSDQDGGDADGRIRKRACNDNRSVSKCPPSSSLPPVHDNVQDQPLPQSESLKETPKLVFNRVDVSKRMKLIVNKLRPLRQEVSKMLRTLGSSWNDVPNIAQGRLTTISESIEPKLYGRDPIMKTIIYDITKGKYCGEDLTLIPIVGPGGIGKTTVAQHIYHNQEVQKHFQVKVWMCISLNFNADRLTKEIEKVIPKVEDENQGTAEELIGQRLKSQRFLLVLDDMWECSNEDEWKRLLLPFKKSQAKGNTILVTTRVQTIAQMVKISDPPIELEGLDREEFKKLFLAFVFGDKQPRKDQSMLLETGDKIMEKLKGNPLAAKTVGRLLRNHLDLDHWERVLENKEWASQKSDNGIMPALKLSYDYLPFHLQQCFSHCSLFPEDYEFCSDELVHLWIGLDVLHSCGQNKRREDIAGSYLVDLVNHGFLKRNEKDDGTPYYVVHDLLHDLAVTVSSYECISIYSSNVRSIEIPISVRHLSIVVDDKEVENRVNFENFKRELRELDKRLNVENLRTLMLFGSHHGSYAKIFGHLFMEARAIRTLYLSGASYNVEDILHNFSKLVHLRHLRIKSSSEYNNDTCLPAALSRLYHLEVIDLQEWKGCFDFTRHMSNLVKLRHFLVPEDKLQLHSDIVEVGKMKLLQELRRFQVGKERKGFDLSQLGELTELGGSLEIRDLERLQTMKEADEARLIQVKRLHKLTLEWGDNRPEKDIVHEENALEILAPHNNLQHLCIRGHRGTKCPQWLGEKLSVKKLESLHLDGVAWNIFPPIGELWLVNGPHEEISSNICNTKFQNLRRLELVKLPRLKTWVVDVPCQLFVHLEVLIIKDCSKLTKLSFANFTCCQREKNKEANMNWFPSLRELKIQDCPELVSFPLVPWTSAPCSAEISRIATGLDNFVCGKKDKSEYRLDIRGAIDLDSTFWNVLAFGNLCEIERLVINRCPPLPLHHFRMLSSLKTLEIRKSSGIVIPLVEGQGRVEYQFPIERITIHRWGASAKELTQLLTYFPKLLELTVCKCEKITVLGVAYVAQIEHHHNQQQDGTRGGEEGIAAEIEGLLLLPSQLQKLLIGFCPELILRSDPVDDNREAGRTGGRQGLQGLHFLQSLCIKDCPRFLSSYLSSSVSPCFPFPTSLEYLYLDGVGGMETLLPLSNLTSLTDLSISNCGELRGEGLQPLLAQGRITRLLVHGTPNLFTGLESSLPHEQQFLSSSFKPQKLWTDDVAGVLAAPIWALLSSSLTELHFYDVKEVERFTKEQEEALQLLTSLERIRFRMCVKLQCLPAGLRKLPNLERLYIYDCAAIRSLPNEGFPSSLQELYIEDCPAIRLMPRECLPNSLQKLRIRGCPAIRSLPKVDDLPSSLQELDVRYRNSEELRRQCRKLIGTIPVVIA